MKVVTDISGGADSTYLLWKLLSTTTDEVTAIFIDGSASNYERVIYDLRGVSNEHSIPIIRQTVENVVAWLKQNVRDFNFVVYNLDVNVFPIGNNIPNSRTAFWAKKAIDGLNAGIYDKMCMASEYENDGFSDVGTTNIRRGNASAAHDVFVQLATRGSLEFPLFSMNYNQSNAYAEMPRALFNLSRSCESPTPQPCNVCFKCRKRAFVCEMIDTGNTPAQVGEYIDSKSRLPNGKWVSMKNWLTPNGPPPYPEWDMPQWPPAVTQA